MFCGCSAREGLKMICRDNGGGAQAPRPLNPLENVWAKNQNVVVQWVVRFTKLHFVKKIILDLDTC